MRWLTWMISCIPLIPHLVYALPASTNATVLVTLETDNNNTEARAGWTPEPNGRGTIGIITNTLFTLFLCSWSLLCVNIPAPREKKLFKLYRKLYLTVLTVLGPEFIFQIALGQLYSALESVKDFEAAGIKGWTITHAFYADMGGFVLQAKSHGCADQNWKAFPIDAKQLIYLIKHKYIKEPPKITVEQIRDKNKLDRLLRLITVGQTLWFLVNIIARLVQSLAITSIEITLTAFIFIGICTQACWYYKPADIDVAEIIEIDTAIEDILLEAGNTSMGIWSRTPLDFINRQEWPFSVLWSAGRGYFRTAGFHFGIRSAPIQRIENTNVHEIKGFGQIVPPLVASIYFSIFFMAWGYSFPTKVEQTLWRTSCFICLSCVPAFYVSNFIAFKLYPMLEARYPILNRDNLWIRIGGDYELSKSRNPLCKALGLTFNYFRNNSVMKEPQLDTPLKSVIPTWLIGIVYCSARVYIWAEDFAELRSLPVSAYDTASWSWIAPWW